MPRFFVTEQPQDGFLSLLGEAAHHAGHVLRLRPGETLTLCDGACTEYDCTVVSVEKERVLCRVEHTHPSAAEPLQRYTLYMALPKSDKMEWVIQKTVELGVSRIVPYHSRNCVPRLEKAEKRAARWQRVALEAAGQSGRGVLPEVAPAVPFQDALAEAACAETALFFYECERENVLRDVLSKGIGATVSIFIGPEGGFSPEEVNAAKQAGMRTVSLGPRVLRCETAPIVAMTAVLYAGGNM